MIIKIEAAISMVFLRVVMIQIYQNHYPLTTVYKHLQTKAKQIVSV